MRRRRRRRYSVAVGTGCRIRIANIHKEYCLQLGRVATRCRAAFERLQRFALKALLALPMNTSTALLYQLTELPPMPDRAAELGGRWVAHPCDAA